jgi:hypothetical protein
MQATGKTKKQKQILKLVSLNTYTPIEPNESSAPKIQSVNYYK